MGKKIEARYVLCILSVVFPCRTALIQDLPQLVKKYPVQPALVIERRDIRSQGEQNEITCTKEYQKIPGHTLCMTDDSRVKHYGVKDDDKLMITRYHNDLRSQVQPPATDLIKLKWDDRLAAVAGKWARQCNTSHDKERSIPGMGLSVGQNIALGYETWQEAIQAWYDEIKDFQYGLDPDSYPGLNGWMKIGHFTQIVQNGTYLIGCGYAECLDTKYDRFYVCNYASGQSDLAYPYTEGPRCGSCPNKCKDGICDCGDTVCYNKGTLDPSTCTCSCLPLYKGDNCEKLDCPEKDKWMCVGLWPVEYCDKFSNVPEQCPHMCGVCGEEGEQEGEEDDVVVPPVIEVFTSGFGCEYTGERDDDVTCLQYGDRGADKPECASEDGPMKCKDCTQFNITKEFCPVMCGLCNPPCNGLPCRHDGSLDTDSCMCSCRKPFTGKSCENVNCPAGGDPVFCKQWPRRYCRKFPIIKEDCPYKCGIC